MTQLKDFEELMDKVNRWRQAPMTRQHKVKLGLALGAIIVVVDCLNYLAIGLFALSVPMLLVPGLFPVWFIFLLLPVWWLLCTAMSLRIMWIAIWHASALLRHLYEPNRSRKAEDRLRYLGMVEDWRITKVLFMYAALAFALMHAWCSSLGGIGCDSWVFKVVVLVLSIEGTIILGMFVIRLLEGSLEDMDRSIFAG